MKTFLICPSRRPSVGLLAEALPLVHIPALGQCLVEYWLTCLANAGEREVYLLANDRPEWLRALVGNGARWGLSVKVIAESRELTPAEVLLKYEKKLGPNFLQERIIVMDHFPSQPNQSLFTGYSDWFSGLCAWMPYALMPDRVGLRQYAPGIWLGANARISPTAKITPPCWLGKNVLVGDGATVGPCAMIEDGSVIEAHAEVVESYISPDTLVGECTEIRNSVVCGSTLINWKTNSVTHVHDAFILCALRQPRVPKRPLSERLAGITSSETPQEALSWEDLVLKNPGSS